MSNLTETEKQIDFSKNLLNSTIISKIHITPDLAIFRIMPDAGVSDFKAGQYVALGLHDKNTNKLIKRAYSIGSSPENKEYLEFYIAIVANGELTSNLGSLKEGDRVYTAPKITGHFTLDPIPEDSPVIMIATGTGLAPFISMLKTGDLLKTRKITLVHGVRHITDLAYREELLMLQSMYIQNLKYFCVVSRDEETDNIYKGYVQSLIERDILQLDPTKDHVLMCGNPRMIEDVEKLLTPKGFIVHSKKTPGNLHFEKYW